VVDDHNRPLPAISAPGRGSARFAPDWWSFAGAMGGTVAATLLDVAASATDPLRRPRQATFHFLSSVRAAQLDIEATALREGRTSTTVVVTSTTDGRAAVHATVVSTVANPSAARYAGTSAPRVPGPDDCDVAELPPGLVPFATHYEFRFIGDSYPHAGTGRAELLAWIRPHADGPHDAGQLAIIADAMPPGLFAVAAAPVVMPTVDLSLVLTETPPVDGPLLVRMTTRSLDHAWCVDDCDIWSRQGQLLGQARQSRLVVGADEELLAFGRSVGHDGVPRKVRR
jgi:acyl-CoA thioesterase